MKLPITTPEHECFFLPWRLHTLLVPLCLLLGAVVQAQDVEYTDVTVDEGLSVGANVGIGGDVGINGGLSIGLDPYNFNELSMVATQDGDNTDATFSADYLTNWTWQSDGADEFYLDDAIVQMTLDYDSVLSVYGASYTTMALDPGNQSLFFNSSTLQVNDGNFIMSNNGGIDNITFNPDDQTISFSSGLTINGSDGNLAVSGNLTLFVGDNGFVPGNGASASGYRSAALGGSSIAAGSSSVALASGISYGSEAISMSEGTANGDDSVAMSEGTANGNWSVAMIGGMTSGNAYDGLAIGSGAYANATDAMALGNGATAQVWSSLTVGHYNANITGNSSAWAATDPAFIVGTGNSSIPANGLVVLNNGNTTVGSNLTVGGTLSISGNVTGNVTLTGNVTVTQPQGDIPMGAYGN